MPLPALTDDTELEGFRSGNVPTLLAQAEARVRSYCGWHIAPSVTETRTLYGRGRNLFLPSRYVTAIVSVTDAATPVPVDTWTLRDDAYLERADGYADWPKRTPVVVEFTHGYPETPADVQQVVHDMVNRALDSVKSPGLSRKRVGDVDRAWLAGEKVTLTDDNRDALSPYRILAFA